MNYVRRCEPGEELEVERKQEKSASLEDFLEGGGEDVPGSQGEAGDSLEQDSEEIVYVRALFPLDTEDPDTLRLEEGDIIRVMASKENLAGVRWGDEDSFWIEGELMGPDLTPRSPPVVGSFPSNYVEAYSPG